MEMNLSKHLREIQKNVESQLNYFKTLDEIYIKEAAIDNIAEQLGISEKELREKLEIFEANNLVKIRNIKVTIKSLSGRRAKRSRWMTLRKDVVCPRFPFY